MAADTPAVSAIIPVHNGAAFLGQAIESVLGQDLPPRELIVVDDGSTDGSGAIAQSYGAALRYFRQEQAGAGAARNRGVAESGGDLLAFLDADDIWRPDKLRLQTAHLEERPALDGVFGLVAIFTEPEAAGRFLVNAKQGSPGLVPGTLLIRKAAFQRAGNFATGRMTGEFIDWYGRAADQGLSLGLVDEVLLFRRVHGQNLTLSASQSGHSDYLAVVRAALLRRRKAGA